MKILTDMSMEIKGLRCRRLMSVQVQSTLITRWIIHTTLPITCSLHGELHRRNSPAGKSWFGLGLKWGKPTGWIAHRRAKALLVTAFALRLAA